MIDFDQTSAENFSLLCRLIIDGRANCFLAEERLACLNVDGVPYMLIGKETSQGILFEFID